jgi:hypothetical protein
MKTKEWANIKGQRKGKKCRLEESTVNIKKIVSEVNTDRRE